MKKSILSLLFAAGIGFVVGLLVILLFMNETVREYVVGAVLFEDYFVYIFVGVWAVGLIVTVIGLMMGRRISMKNKEKVDDPDLLDDWTQRNFYTAQEFSNTGLLLAILSAAVVVTGAVLTEDVSKVVMGIFLVMSVAIIFFAAFVSFYLAGMMHVLYPERDLPSIHDKNYQEKLFEVSDDGERFLILKGLYKSNQTTQMNLLLGVLLLIFVSAATETNQLLAIVVILFIFGMNYMKYSRTLKNEIK